MCRQACALNLPLHTALGTAQDKELPADFSSSSGSAVISQAGWRVRLQVEFLTGPKCQRGLSEAY